MKEKTKYIIGLCILLILFVTILLISNVFKPVKVEKHVTEITSNLHELDQPQSTTSTTTTTTVTTTKKTTKKVIKTTKKNTLNKIPTASKAEYIEYARQRSGYNDTQMQCLDWLWTRESGWNPNSFNGQSSACGIPQACPCKKTNEAYKSSWKAQIDWGISYIANRYHGDPCSAWNHFKNSKPHSY